MSKFNIFNIEHFNISNEVCLWIIGFSLMFETFGLEMIHHCHKC